LIHAAHKSETAARRNRIAVILLSLVAVVALLGASFQFARLLNIGRGLDVVVREDALWAVFQADRHMRQFQSHLQMMLLNGGKAEQHEILLRNYDILYSRVVLMERGTFHLNLGQGGALTENSRKLAQFVVGLEARIDTLDPDAPDYLAQMEHVLSQTAAFPDLTNSMLLDANAGMNALRGAERHLRSAVQEQFIAKMVVVVSAFLGIFCLLFLQLRHLSHAGRRMAVLEKRSRLSAQRARAASRAKSAFLATMSHEMRTPLNGITGVVDYLALNARDTPFKSHLDTLRASALHLGSVIDGILELSRMEKTRPEPVPEAVELVQLGHSLWLSHKARADIAGLSLQMQIPDLVVMADPALLRQVMTRLLDNALKFSRQGKVTVRASCLASGLLRVEVEDEGIGIAPGEEARLFRAFEQGDQTFSRNFSGSGLGLAMCRHLVTAMGGKIGATSLTNGSLFWFEIPAPPVPKHLAAPDEKTSAHALRIVIAEDNQINQEVLCAHLAQMGHDCALACTGEEAVEIITRNPPDLVFMDMQMPVMDGLEATRKIRAAGHAMPIIAVTANSFARDRANCARAGMTGFISKPITREALARALAKIAIAPSHQPALQQQPPLQKEHTSCAQLRDLVSALGVEMVASLIDTFEREISAFSQSLQESCLSADSVAQDSLLHTFKGAALTLGMVKSGNFAQAKRAALPLSSRDAEALVTNARADVAILRQSLGGMCKHEAPADA
jgi:two-component system, sensor histidine kinase